MFEKKKYEKKINNCVEVLLNFYKQNVDPKVLEKVIFYEGEHTGMKLLRFDFEWLKTFIDFEGVSWKNVLVRDLNFEDSKNVAFNPNEVWSKDLSNTVLTDVYLTGNQNMFDGCKIFGMDTTGSENGILDVSKVKDIKTNYSVLEDIKLITDKIRFKLYLPEIKEIIKNPEVLLEKKHLYEINEFQELIFTVTWDEFIKLLDQLELVKPYNFELNPKIIENNIFEYKTDYIDLQYKQFKYDKKILKKLDLTNVSFNDFAAKKFDFTGLTGVSIFPRYLYEKDLSYSVVSGVDFIGNELMFDCCKIEGINTKNSRNCKIYFDKLNGDIDNCNFEDATLIGSPLQTFAYVDESTKILGAKINNILINQDIENVLLERYEYEEVSNDSPELLTQSLVQETSNENDIYSDDINLVKEIFEKVYNIRGYIRKLPEEDNTIYNLYDYGVDSKVIDKILFKYDGNHKSLAIDSKAMKKLDWTNTSWDNVNVRSLDFTGCVGITINPQKVHAKNFFNTNLNGVTLVGNDDMFNDCTITGTKTQGAINCKIDLQKIKDKDASRSDLTGATLIGVGDIFKEVNLEDAKIDFNKFPLFAKEINELDVVLQRIKTKN